MSEKSLDALLDELRKERIALEERIHRTNRSSGSAAALTREVADDLRLLGLDRRERRLLAEKDKAESEQRKRTAFDNAFDNAFGVSGDNAEHDADDN